MATRTLRLTVSAGADRSLTTVMQPFVDSVRKARKQVAEEAAAMGADLARGIPQGRGGRHRRRPTSCATPT